jgi:hypothetical protein
MSDQADGLRERVLARSGTAATRAGPGPPKDGAPGFSGAPAGVGTAGPAVALDALGRRVVRTVPRRLYRVTRI